MSDRILVLEYNSKEGQDAKCVQKRLADRLEFEDGRMNKRL